MHLTDSIVCLHRELKEKTYRHGPYHAFGINDPKPRHIHKASVQDRLVHHAIYRKLYTFFDRLFIHDSYSCRKGKGTHKAMDRFRKFARQVSRNNTRTAWVLKCDIRKFFANINHEILMNILRGRITDEDTLWLLGQIIDSFCIDGRSGVGLPLGNLTSQLFVNVYMNVFDQFVKRKLKARHYIRYADDFVILHPDRTYLEGILPGIVAFLKKELRLSLHPGKIRVKTVASGVDFLGWVHFPDHRVLRTATKKRMFRKLRENPNNESVASYLGLLKHGNTHKVQQSMPSVAPRK
ncbi:MAG: reverse transcriptase/maturase family protein [Patescibacteria group bacterium]